MAGTSWPDEIISYMQSLTDAGHSASVIAADTSSKFGIDCSRNAVIGLWHRNRVGRGTPRDGTKPPKRRKPSSVRIKKSTSMSCFSTAPRRKVDMTIEECPDYDGPVNGKGLVFVVENGPEQCKWPVSGDKHHLMVCGQPVAPGDKSYCSHHRNRATSQ